MKQYVSFVFIVKDWILDSITEFLKSPIWKNPILEFIDKHCMGFDDEEENKLEYTTIHKVNIGLIKLNPGVQETSRH